MLSRLSLEYHLCSKADFQYVTKSISDKELEFPQAFEAHNINSQLIMHITVKSACLNNLQQVVPHSELKMEKLIFSENETANVRQSFRVFSETETN